MSNIVIPAIEDGITWESLRLGIKGCIEAALTEDNVLKARVYSTWPLKFDIGETINLLVSETDNDKVHAWIVGINRAIPNDAGRTGGHFLEWPLNIRIWGFLGYDSVYTANTQATMEEEIRSITRVIYANSKTLGRDDVHDIVTSGIVEWEVIDTMAFGGGSDVIVAQGNLGLAIREHYNGY